MYVSLVAVFNILYEKNEIQQQQKEVCVSVCVYVRMKTDEKNIQYRSMSTLDLFTYGTHFSREKTHTYKYILFSVL